LLPRKTILLPYKIILLGNKIAPLPSRAALSANKMPPLPSRAALSGNKISPLPTRAALSANKTTLLRTRAALFRRPRRSSGRLTRIGLRVATWIAIAVLAVAIPIPEGIWYFGSRSPMARSGRIEWVNDWDEHVYNVPRLDAVNRDQACAPRAAPVARPSGAWKEDRRRRDGRITPPMQRTGDDGIL
jgi:hypothetical protein